MGMGALLGGLSSHVRAEEDGKKKIVLIAGSKSHGYAAHGHYPGCLLLAKSLQANVPNVKCVVVKDGFPIDTSVFKNCDAVVVFSDGGGGHPYKAHLKEIDE